MPDAQGHKTCPICRKPASDRFRPFCSRRCADVDLNRWFSGVYAVPVSEDEAEDERREDNGEARAVTAADKGRTPPFGRP